MFEVRRRLGVADAIYGLGEKTGPFNRRGRAYTLWNTDVLSPHATAEFAGERASADFDPYYVSIPFYYHHTRGRRR